MDLIVVGVRSVDFDLERRDCLGEDGFDELGDVFRLDFAGVDNRRVSRCGIGAQYREEIREARYRCPKVRFRSLFCLVVLSYCCSFISSDRDWVLVRGETGGENQHVKRNRFT